MPREEAAQAFYRCWTRKERSSRYWDRILGQLNAFSVSVDPDKARLLHVEASLGQADDWTFAVLDDQTHIPPYAARLLSKANGASITSHNYACRDSFIEDRVAPPRGLLRLRRRENPVEPPP